MHALLIRQFSCYFSDSDSSPHRAKKSSSGRHKGRDEPERRRDEPERRRDEPERRRDEPERRKDESEKRVVRRTSTSPQRRDK